MAINNELEESQEVEEYKEVAESKEVDDSDVLAEALGSISPLIITFFSLLISIIFLISNVASAYVARRDLINRVESALSIAAQELDEFTYYYGSPLTDYLTELGIKEGNLRVPVDCNSARNIFLRILKNESLNSFTRYEGEVQGTYRQGTSQSTSTQSPSTSSTITIKSFKCDGYELSASVEEIKDLPFQLRVFNLTTFTNQVSASSSSFLRSDSD